MKYTCTNAAYSDFINKFINSKPWFYSEIIYAIQKKDKVYLKYKNSGLETNKVKFKTSKIFLQKMLYRKKSSYFKEKVVENYKILKSYENFRSPFALTFS